jgi:hypothetical protein
VVVSPDVTGVATADQGPVVAVVSEGPNGSAALELAVRVAFSRHCSLRLIPETGSRKLIRQAAERAEELMRAGLECQVQPGTDGPLEAALAESGPGLVVVAVGDDGTARGQQLAHAAGAVVLLVRASTDDEG